MEGTNLIKRIVPVVVGSLPFAIALLAQGGCTPETMDQLPDGITVQASCNQANRPDAMVRKEALAEFARLGKTCEAYDLKLFAQNDRETLWKACCGAAALNYIFYPEKCVARRASGLIQCQ